MILWFLLFLLVVAISFVLAYQSMKDYHEVPEKLSNDYGLFLIRNIPALNFSLLNTLHDHLSKKGLLVSIERLFKGNQSAIVVYGPKSVLQDFTSQLNLLELEDYTQTEVHNSYAWEVGIKDKNLFHSQHLSLFFKDLPPLEDQEQFWWQLVLQPQKSQVSASNIIGDIFSGVTSALENKTKQEKKESSYDLAVKKQKVEPSPTPVQPPVVSDSIKTEELEEKTFLSQIRAVIVSPSVDRRKILSEQLQKLAEGNLGKVPKPFTSGQILEFYKLRSLPTEKLGTAVLNSNEVIRMSQLG